MHLRLALSHFGFSKKDPNSKYRDTFVSHCIAERYRRKVKRGFKCKGQFRQNSIVIHVKDGTIAIRIDRSKNDNDFIKRTEYERVFILLQKCK